jgi:ribonuclease P protein component
VAAGLHRSERFPKESRLRKRADYLKVQEAGFKVSTEPLLVLALRNPNGVTRLGVTISTKVGNSVVRHRIRRCLKELFRKRKDELPLGIDVVFIAKQQAAPGDLTALSRAFDQAVDRLQRKFS